MEKIKDFIHDYSDLFMAMIIIVIMVFVVQVNLTTMFEEDSSAIAHTADQRINDHDSGVLDQSSMEPEEIIMIDLPEISEERPDPDQSDEPISPENNVPQPSVSPPAPGERISITIPNGTPGIGIARILVEKQLLQDTTPFVEAAESLNLSLKLKSGTFQIPAGSTPEEMVHIIAGE